MSHAKIDKKNVRRKSAGKLLTDSEVAQLKDLMQQDGGIASFALRVNQIQEQQRGERVNVASTDRVLRRITESKQDERHPLTPRVAQLLSVAFGQMSVSCPPWCYSLIGAIGVSQRESLDHLAFPDVHALEEAIERSSFLKTQDAVAILMAESLAAKRPLTIVAPNLSIFPLTIRSGDCLSLRESLLSTEHLTAVLNNAGIQVILSMPDLQYWIQQNPPELLNAMAQWLQSEPSVVPYLTEQRLNGTFIGSFKSTLYLPPECSKGMFEHIPAADKLGKAPSILNDLFWDLVSSAPKDHKGTANVISKLQEIRRLTS